MTIGYDTPLYILPFDHRASFEKGLFGFTPPLTEAQTAQVAASKRVVYDGLLLALSQGAPKAASGILVDEQFGGAILRDAHSQGLITCAPAEKSGQDEFQFEYGEAWRDHIAAFRPDFVKVLVRYNPQGDAALNRRQAARLAELGRYVHDQGLRFMFELLVPPTKAQFDHVDHDQNAYDHDLRPSLMVAAITELQDQGVAADVWKIEGLDQRADCERVVQTVRRGGRDRVGCIILGRGADEAGIVAWLQAAAPVSGFIGFAVGRTSFWDALTDWRAGKASHEQAAGRIAARYLEWIRVFEDARKAGPSRD